MYMSIPLTSFHTRSPPPIDFSHAFAIFSCLVCLTTVNRPDSSEGPTEVSRSPRPQPTSSVWSAPRVRWYATREMYLCLVGAHPKPVLSTRSSLRQTTYMVYEGEGQAKYVPTGCVEGV